MRRRKVRRFAALAMAVLMTISHMAVGDVSGGLSGTRAEETADTGDIYLDGSASLIVEDDVILSEEGNSGEDQLLEADGNESSEEKGEGAEDGRNPEEDNESLSEDAEDSDGIDGAENEDEEFPAEEENLSGESSGGDEEDANNLTESKGESAPAAASSYAEDTETENAASAVEVDEKSTGSESLVEDEESDYEKSSSEEDGSEEGEGISLEEKGEADSDLDEGDAEAPAESEEAGEDSEGEGAGAFSGNEEGFEEMDGEAGEDVQTEEEGVFSYGSDEDTDDSDGDDDGFMNGGVVDDGDYGDALVIPSDKAASLSNASNPSGNGTSKETQNEGSGNPSEDGRTESFEDEDTGTISDGGDIAPADTEESADADTGSNDAAADSHDGRYDTEDKASAGDVGEKSGGAIKDGTGKADGGADAENADGTKDGEALLLEEEEEALLVETEEEASLLSIEEDYEDTQVDYGYDHESNTITIILGKDFNEDLVVLDSPRDEGISGDESDGERLEVILDLNGHTLTPKGEKNHTGITVFGSLTIQDSVGGGRIDGTGLENTRGIEVATRGILRIENNVTISNFDVEGNGGGILVDKGGTVYLAGSRIEGNSAAENGGGLFAYAANSVIFEVEEGTKNIISGNRAKNGGGLAFAMAGDVKKDPFDGSDLDNTLYLHDLVLSDNEAEVNGGGFYGDAVLEVDADGMELSGNTAAQSGGGMYFKGASSVMSFNKSQLFGNVAENANGGAVAMAGEGSTLSFHNSVLGEDLDDEGFKFETVEDSLPEEDKIVSLSERANRASKGNGGGIYMYRKAVFKLDKSDIAGNMAYKYGGGFFIDGANNYISTVDMKDSRIENNVLEEETAGRYGGGGCVWGYAVITGENMLFRGNYGAHRGSGLYVHEHTKSMSFTNSKFIRNHFESIMTGSYDGYGGGFFIANSTQANAMLRLEDCLFLENQADSSGCGSAGFYAGTISRELINCVFRANYASGSSGGAGMAGGACTTLVKGCLFEDNKAFYERQDSSYGGMSVGGTELVMEDTVFRNNMCYHCGGGFGSSCTNTFLKKGVLVENNRATGEGWSGSRGGGAYFSGTVTMQDGVVFKNNSSTEYGGGLWTANLNMEGGTITENRSGHGGGLYSGNTLIMTGGEITNNTATSRWGGGIYQDGYSDGSVISGGLISGNTASDGGGIMSNACNYQNRLLTITGDAKIINNTATSCGGGIYLYCRGHLLVEGNARIENNTANSEGGGIYVYYLADNVTNPLYPYSLDIQGGFIRYNHSKGWGNDIRSSSSWTSDQAYRRRNLRFAATAPGTAWYNERTREYMTEAWDNKALNDEWRILDMLEENPVHNSANYDFIFCELEGEAAKIQETGSVFPSVQAAIDAAVDGQTVLMLHDQLENVSVPEGKTVTLDLAGCNLHAPRLGSVITVGENAVFTLRDSSEGQTGVVSDGRGNYVVLEEGDYFRPKWTFGGAVNVRSGAKFYFEGGTMKNNAAYAGSAVYLTEGAEMVMSGGSIYSNNFSESGYDLGAVCVYLPDELNGNPAKHADRGYLGAAFTMTGGEIRGNDSCGIGLFGCSSVVRIEGDARISKNTNRGGINGNIGSRKAGEEYPEYNLVITGGEITGNSSDGGGAVRMYGGVYAQITGGVFSNNSATYGGAFYLRDWNRLLLSGNAIVSGNTGTYGGGAYLMNGARLVMAEQAVISENTGTSNGGGIFSEAGGRFLMEGGAVFGNRNGQGNWKRGTDFYFKKGNANTEILLRDVSAMQKDGYDIWLNESTGEEYTSLAASFSNGDPEALAEALSTVVKQGVLMLRATKSDSRAALIREVEYPTLQAALDAAKDGDVIYLLKDLQESVVMQNYQKSLVLDLNGYTLSGVKEQIIYMNRVLGTLTVRNTLDQEDHGPNEVGQLLEEVPEEGEAARDMRAFYVRGGGIVLDGIHVSGFHHSGSGGAIYLGTSQLNNNTNHDTNTYYDGTLLVTNGSVFENCSSNGSGGAVYAYSYSDNGWNSTITSIIVEGESTFQNCYAKSNGGAIYQNADVVCYLEGKQNVLRLSGGSKFLNNECVANGGAVWFQGWRDSKNYRDARQEDVRIYDVTISDNRAKNKGGGVYLYACSPVIGRERAEGEEEHSTHFNRNTVWRAHNGWAGGGLYIEAWSNALEYATLRNLDISGNYAFTDGGGLALYSMPASIKDCDIEYNTVSEYQGYAGGLCYKGASSLDSSRALTMEDCVIQGNRARYGGGMHLDTIANGSLFRNVKVTNNFAKEQGGGIRIRDGSYTAGSVFTLDHCAISNNAHNGVDAYFHRLAVDFHDCEVKDNVGGISMSCNQTIYSRTTPEEIALEIEKYPIFILSGSTVVSGHTGRGVYSNVRTYIRDNVQIINNSVNGNGGAFYQHNGSFEMTGGTISGNTAQNGGGIYFNRDWNFVLANEFDNVINGENARISNNTANHPNPSWECGGGGIYLSHYNKLAIKNGEVTGNTTNNYGGGIFVQYARSNLTLSDQGKIYGNKALYGQDVLGNFHSSYSNESATQINLMKASDMFLDEEGQAGGHQGVCWLEERSDERFTDVIKGHLSHIVRLTLEYKTVKPAAAVKDSPDSSTYAIYNSVQDAIGAILEGRHGAYEGGRKPEIVLVDDVSENVLIPGSADIILNLNGHLLEGIGMSAIKCDGIVEIVDEKKAVTGNAEAESRIFDAGEGTGTIRGTAYVAGGGIFVENGGYAVLSSGQVSGSRAGNNNSNNSYGGGAVCVDAGTFVLRGSGALRENICQYYGAAVLVKNKSSSFRMEGGVIEGNRCLDGVVYNRGGFVIISGGTIQKNTITGCGTVLTTSDGITSIAGTDGANPVRIINNTASVKGAAAYIGSGRMMLSNVLMEGNKVTSVLGGSGNNANGGGAVYQAGGTVYISDGTVIRNNTACRGAGFYQNAGKTYMMGGIITGNRAQRGGGIAQYPLGVGEFIMSQGYVAGNFTTDYNAGNDIYSWYEGTGDYYHGNNVNYWPKFTAAPAFQMGDESYNAWKDDTYNGKTRTSKIITTHEDSSVGGQYITGSIMNSANLQLTASHYDTEVNKEFDNDVYIVSLLMQDDKGDYGLKDGSSVNSAMLEHEKTVEQMEGAVLQEDGSYLYNGQSYEAGQIAAWKAGEDSSQNNRLVRSFDTMIYSFKISIKIREDAVKKEKRTVHPWLEIELPCDTTEAEFDLTKLQQIFTSAPSYSIKQVDGKTVQTISGYWEEVMEGQTRDATVRSKPVTISIHGMKNGDTLKPRFRAWIEGNETNESGTPSNAAEQGSGNGGGDGNTNSDNSTTSTVQTPSASAPQTMSVTTMQSVSTAAGQTASFAEAQSVSVAEDNGGESSGLNGTREELEAAMAGMEEMVEEAASLFEDGDGSAGGGTVGASGESDGSGRNWVEYVNCFDSPTITISAVPKYDVMIDYNSRMAYDGYFNLRTGEESTAEEYRRAQLDGDTDIIHGMMLGYGLLVSLYNDNTKEALKGLEFPERELSFDVSFRGKLYYNTEPLFKEGSEYEALGTGRPYIWAYKENVNSKLGKPLNEPALYTMNMDWNDEDDITKFTRYAWNAAPFNSGGGENACYSGGSWEVTGQQPVGVDGTGGPVGGTDGTGGTGSTTGEGDGAGNAAGFSNGTETTVHVKVTNYGLNSDSYPNKSSDGQMDDRFNTSAIKPFTAGYIQVVFPYNEDKIKEAYALENDGKVFSGYLTVAMEASVSNFNAKGKSGDDPVSADDPKGLETLNTYYGRPNDSDLAEEGIAVREMRYADNYSFNDFQRYIPGQGSGGDGDTISKTAYFLKKSGAELTGSGGKGSTPINSAVYVGGEVTFQSRLIHTDDIEEPRYYIDEKDFSTTRDNLVEYNYMTALNLLQKFDAEVYHPAYANSTTINKSVTGSYTLQGKDRDGKAVNAFTISTTETDAEWDEISDSKPRRFFLTILYAAKPDGENWVKEPKQVGNDILDDGGAADMDRYHEENLLYYSSLKALEDDGKTCVAILYEFRNTAIRTGRSIKANAYLDVTSDFTKTGNTYITTNDVRAWKTYRRYFKEMWRKVTKDKWDTNWQKYLYSYSYWTDSSYTPLPAGSTRERYGEDASSEGANDSLSQRSAWERKVYTKEDTEEGVKTRYIGNSTFTGYTFFHRSYDDLLEGGNYYNKTQYRRGNRVPGTHNGWDHGNVLLLYTLDTAIAIHNIDIPVGSNAYQSSYNVTKGERIVNYRVWPEINVSSEATPTPLVENGTQSVQVNIELALPEKLHYREGSFTLEYGSSEYTADQMQWEAVPSEDGRKIMVTVFVTDAKKKLPNFTFACDIGDMRDDEKDVKHGDWLQVSSTIWAEYQEVNRLAAEAHVSAVTVSVVKETSSGIKKDVGETLVELGEDLVYTLSYVNGSKSAVSGRFADVLPYNGDARSTDFTGAYRVKRIDVLFQDGLSYDRFLGDGTEDAVKGRLFYLAGATVPANEEAQAALIARMSDAGSGLGELVDGQDGVEVEEDADNLSVSYLIQSDMLLQTEGAQNAYALFALVPNLAGMDEGKVEEDKGLKKGVTIRIVLSPVSADNSDGEKMLEYRVNNTTTRVQSGGKQYGNNFLFYDGPMENVPNPASVMRSSIVRISTVGRYISGLVWLDKDRDNLYASKNSNDLLMQNVDVYLLKEDGNGNYVTATDVLGREVVPVRTSNQGRYFFENLGPGNYKVEIRNDRDPKVAYNVVSTNNNITKKPIDFNLLALADKNVGKVAGSKGEFAGISEGAAEVAGTVATGSKLVARTVNIPLPRKDEISGGVYPSPNWNFGLFYMTPALEKQWDKMMFPVSGSTEVKLKLVGTIGGEAEGDGGGSDTETLVGENQMEKTVVYSNNLVMKQAGKAVTSSPTVPAGMAAWINNVRGGTFADRVETRAGESAPSYYWTFETTAIPLPARAYLDGVEYDVSYHLEEELVKGTTDVESVWLTPVTSVSVSEDKAVVSLKAMNERVLSEFGFTKVDSKDSSKHLSGAQFTLYRSRGEFSTFQAGDAVAMVKLGDGTYRPKHGNETTASVTVMDVAKGGGSGENDRNLGELSVKSLPVGCYWLKEGKSPEGYNLPGGYWKITVSRDGTVKTGVVGSVNSQPKVEDEDYVNADDLRYFNLPNPAGFAMARTGGSGTRGFAFFGLLAVMAGAAGWWLDRRKRRAAA